VMNGDAQSFTGVQNYVWRNRYLLSPDVTASGFSVAGLQSALTSDLALLGSELGMVMGQSLASDPTGEMLGLLKQFDSGTGPAQQDGAWVAQDGRTALLLAHTASPGFDLDAQQLALAAISDHFAQARAAMPGAGSATLQMSGPGVFAVRTRDTGPELQVRLLLRGLGCRYRLHGPSLPGRPDVVLTGRRKVIFVHGCFWHRHPRCRYATIPKSRVAYWMEKFTANRKRDRKNLRDLSALGWNCFVVWQCQLKRPKTVERRIREFLSNQNVS